MGVGSMAKLMTYKGHLICKRCGGIELEGSICCKIQKLPFEMKKRAEDKIEAWVSGEEAQRKFGYKELPRVEGSEVRAWQIDMTGVSSNKKVWYDDRKQRQNNPYYKEVLSGC
jgi:hypothetical protein